MKKDIGGPSLNVATLRLYNMQPFISQCRDIVTLRCLRDSIRDIFFRYNKKNEENKRGGERDTRRRRLYRRGSRDCEHSSICIFFLSRTPND